MEKFIKGIDYKFILFTLLLCIFSGCEKNKQDSDIITIVQIVSDLKLEDKDHQQALISIDSTLISTQDEIKKGHLYFLKAKYLHKLKQIKKSINNYNLAKDIYKKNELLEPLTNTYSLLGKINLSLSRRERGMELLIEALNYGRMIDNKSIKASIYSSLSRAYFLYKDYQESISHMNKALELYIASKDTVEISATYNNLAIIHRHRRNYSKSIEFNEKSLKINKLRKDSASIAKSYNNLGLVYLDIEDYKMAVSYYKKAIDLNKKANPTNSSPLRNLGLYYLKNGYHNKALPTYKEALSIENKKEITANMKDIYEALLYISLINKNSESALFYNTKRDSLSKIQHASELKEKLSLVENQFDLIARENDLKQVQEINKRNKIIFVSIIGMVLILSLFVFQIIKTRNLKNEKEKIDIEQYVLRSQMNPHFIFNALTAIQNSLLDNNPLKTATFLSQFAQLIRQNFDNINKKTIPLKEELSMLQNYVATQKLRFKDKFDLILNIEDIINVNEVQIPPLFLQPFVENSIEHGFKNKKTKGVITISVKKKRNRIVYTINDNGKGFETKSNDDKTHSSDVFIRRLKLLEKGNEKSFSIASSSKGTSVKFAISL